MAIPLTGVVGDLTNLIPSSSDVLQQVLLGAGASVVLAGLKSNAGMDAVDPLHLIPRPAPPGGAASVSTVVGKSITSAAFNSLDPAGRAQVLQAGYVVAG